MNIKKISKNVLLVAGLIALGLVAYKINELNRQFAFFKTRIDWDQYNPDLHGMVVEARGAELCYYNHGEREYVHLPSSITPDVVAEYFLSKCRDNSASKLQIAAPRQYTIIATYWKRVPFLINGLGASTAHYVILQDDAETFSRAALSTLPWLTKTKIPEELLEWNRDGMYTR